MRRDPVSERVAQVNGAAATQASSRTHLVAQLFPSRQRLKMREYTHRVRRHGQLVRARFEPGLDFDGAQLWSESKLAAMMLLVIELFKRSNACLEYRRQMTSRLFVAELYIHHSKHQSPGAS